MNTCVQWIVKLVEADEPEAVLDFEISPPSSKRPKRENDCKLYFDNETDGGGKTPIDLVDLTVLTFPRVNVPRFKVRYPACLKFLTQPFTPAVPSRAQMHHFEGERAFP